MLIIPAIDIKDGRCVRLFQGEMDQETIYFENPLEAAKHWVKEGATFIHIVDLNGAVEGRPVHTDVVETICKEAGLSVELGGGLRSVQSVEAALKLGVSRVVIGTAAYDNRIFARDLREVSGKSSSASTRNTAGIAVKAGRNDFHGCHGAGATLRSRRRLANHLTDISRDRTRRGLMSETKLARAGKYL